MAKGDQINLRPHFKEEGDKLPCEGQAGDLYVFSRIGEKDSDLTQFGETSLWFCTKGSQGDQRNAIWQRVQFDGFKTCSAPPPKPPQNPPELKEG